MKEGMESKLIERGWVEDKLMSGRYISPYTKITYTIEQAIRIEEMIYKEVEDKP